jgi:hypothetical protein
MNIQLSLPLAQIVHLRVLATLQLNLPLLQTMPLRFPASIQLNLSLIQAVECLQSRLPDLPEIRLHLVIPTHFRFQISALQEKKIYDKAALRDFHSLFRQKHTDGKGSNGLIRSKNGQTNAISNGVRKFLRK